MSRHRHKAEQHTRARARTHTHTHRKRERGGVGLTSSLSLSLSLSLFLSLSLSAPPSLLHLLQVRRVVPPGRVSACVSLGMRHPLGVWTRGWTGDKDQEAATGDKGGTRGWTGDKDADSDSGGRERHTPSARAYDASRNASRVRRT
jgi:hypothetical protein